MTITYIPKGVCSRKMIVSAENGIITDVKVIGGCDGNLKAICKLVKGMTLDEAISKTEGTTCGRKPTSCPDQLSIVFKKLKENNA